MKRQTNETLASRVYTYGTVPERIAPVRGQDAALAQMKLGNRLWNTLVAIERTRVNRYRAIMHDGEQARIEELKVAIAAARDEMDARRQAARKRAGVDVTDLKAAIDIARAELGPLIEHRKATMKDRHAARQAELHANQAKANKRIKRARQAAASMGLFWGSYNDIVQRADAGRKHGGELHFRSFRGAGTVTAQLMGGASSGQCVEGGHTFFQLDPPTAGQKWRYARMRIGSHADRQPVWLEIPIVYHRDLPGSANIRSVSMTRRTDAGKPRWQLNITVNVPRAAEKTGPAIALDIGWRLLPAGVRVAYWQDDLGEHGEVVIPLSDIQAVQKVADLRSICDQSRDEFLPALAAWLDGRELDDEWKAQSSRLIQWRSPDRLAALIRWWSDHRMEGDPEMYEASTTWRKQYLHVANWWRGQQDQIVARIRERYRVFAAQTARKYGVLVIEDFDLSEVVELPAADSAQAAPANSYRQMVSPSTFRGVLVNAAAREGAAVVKLPAEYTTRTCHACGHHGKWDSATSVSHQCAHCHATWDQDRNAAINLLAAWHASGRLVVEASA